MTITKPNRIDKLTDEQRARMAPFAQEWIERGHRTRPMTDEEWKVWEDGVRACYEYAGKKFPGVVVRVPSPIMRSRSVRVNHADRMSCSSRSRCGGVGRPWAAVA